MTGSLASVHVHIIKIVRLMHKKDKTSRLRSQNRKQGKLKRKEVYYNLFA